MKADYRMMTEIYNILNETVDNMVNSIKEAKKIVNNMDSNTHWDGNGYNAFNKKFSNLSQNFGSYCNDLYVLNNTIKQTIARLKQVDKKLMRR